MSTIRKIFALLIIIGLIIIGIFVYNPFLSEPPALEVTAEGTEISTTQGSYCWDGVFSAQCVDKIYANPLEMVQEHKPVAISPNEKIKIKFKKEPIAGTMKVEQWKGTENGEKIEVNNKTIVVPKEKGLYVYYVAAEWKQGNGNYAFSVEVK